MPYGKPIISIRMLDYDSGDEEDNGMSQEEVFEFLLDRIVKFTFSDSDKKIDKLEMIFRNEDYEMFDRPVFVKGQKLEVIWGWHSNTVAPRRMIVKKVKGGTMITVTCHCPKALLHNKKQSRFLAGVTASEFVRVIAEEYGYRGPLQHIEDTTVRKDITQGRWMTDAQMCQKLAKKEGFQFYIDSTGFHWHSRDTSRTTVKDYIFRVDPRGGEILEPPEFNANLTNGIAKVRVLARDPILKEDIDVSVGINDEDDVSLGSEDELFDPDDPDIGLRGSRISSEAVISGGSLTEVDAKSLAKGMYRDTAKKRYKCQMSVIGDPIVGAKILVGLYNISETLDGIYYVQEAVTEIVSGKYVILLHMEKDALGKVKASSKKKNRQNKNDDAPADEKTNDEYVTKLVAQPNDKGEMVAAWVWVDPNGISKASSQLTEEQYNELPERTKRALFESGVSTYPDR